MEAADRSDALSPLKTNRAASPEFRSVPCNGRLLKHFREMCGWTQSELVLRSGFSRRTIVKAESGESIDWHTLEILAETLREGGAAVSVADLSSDSASLVRRLLKNYAVFQGDFVKHSLDILSPEIVAVMDGDPATNPIAGEYHGIEEFDRLWRKFFTLFARAGGTLGDDPVIQCNGNEVLAWGHEFVHLPEIPPVEPAFVMLRITVKDGWIIRFEDYYEAAGMMHALHRFADEFPEAAWAKELRAKAKCNPSNVAATPSLIAKSKSISS